MTRILIVDDERNLRRMLSAVLEEESHEVHAVDGGTEAVAACETFDPHIVLLDLVMPPGPNGLTVLEQIKARHPELIVIMMSGKATLRDAVRATRLGAFQFLEKPLAPEAVHSVVNAAQNLLGARAEARALRAQLPKLQEIVGSSGIMQEVKALIAQVAATSSRVLITGESGTGKELVARAIHDLSPRSLHPFVPVNCAAVPRELIESEMFGHEKGAFTGAHQRRHGRFELADKGTLFLDEVGDLDAGAQAKLLRVLETGVVERVGGEREHKVDVRLVAATNQDLEREVDSGGFRKDLFYRLNVFPIRVPPLRDRISDIDQLTAHFAQVVAKRCGCRARVFLPEAIERFETYRWPGNVRELTNVVERLTIVGGEGPVEAEEVSAVLGDKGEKGDVGQQSQLPPGQSAFEGLSQALDTYETGLIRQAIAKAEGNLAAAARSLQTDRANLYRRMKRLDIGRNDTSESQ